MFHSQAVMSVGVRCSLNKGKAGENQVSVRVARNEGVDDRNVVLNLTAW